MYVLYAYSKTNQPIAFADTKKDICKTAELAIQNGMLHYGNSSCIRTQLHDFRKDENRSSVYLSSRFGNGRMMKEG